MEASRKPYQEIQAERYDRGGGASDKVDVIETQMNRRPGRFGRQYRGTRDGIWESDR